MRLAVLDVGSNTLHLLVVDAHPGAAPIPATSHKQPLRLAENLRADGSIGEQGARSLLAAVAQAVAVAREQGADELLPFATSALREAPDGGSVLARVREETGVDLQVLSGPAEARLTFLAVRRWFGWSSGRLLALDIGGGSLELAVGDDEEPDVALSLPLGAGRLTRDLGLQDPPRPAQVRRLRATVRDRIDEVVPALLAGGPAQRVVGSSKTFRSLARLAGAAPSAHGPHVRRVLRAADLAGWVADLACRSAAARAELPGVSAGRARQVLAGAVVAEAAMERLGVAELEICPWALREGIILRRIDRMGVGTELGAGPRPGRDPRPAEET